MTHPWERHHRRAVAAGLTLGWSGDAAALLARHLPPPLRVLELGCGQGGLALDLAGRGLEVTALDVSPTAIARAKSNARGAEMPPTYGVADVTEPLPFPPGHFGAVIAVLSLHYFTRRTTANIFREVERVLVPGGLFCFYVNSGAEGRGRAERGEVLRQLEPGVVVERDGVTRRYFSEADLAELLQRWTTLSCDFIWIDSVGRGKSCWRVLARSEHPRAATALPAGVRSR